MEVARAEVAKAEQGARAKEVRADQRWLPTTTIRDGIGNTSTHPPVRPLRYTLIYNSNLSSSGFRWNWGAISKRNGFIPSQYPPFGRL